MNESWHIWISMRDCECAVRRLKFLRCVWGASYENTHPYVPWLIQLCHDSFIWDIHLRHTGHDWFICDFGCVRCMSEVCHTNESRQIWINKSSVNPKSASNQSSKPCTVLQYPSRKMRCMSEVCHTNESGQIWIRDGMYDWANMHTSWNIWMSHGTSCHVTCSYTELPSYTNESCHTWIRLFMCEWVTSRMNALWHICMSHVKYKWVISYE